MSHQEFQIGHGVYFQDFRKGAAVKGLSTFENQPKDILLVLEELRQLDSKTAKLHESIQLIKEEDDWRQDSVYLDCIRENYGVIIKYSKQMESLIKIVQEANYKPNDTELQKLVDLERVVNRRTIYEGEFKEFVKEFMVTAAAEPELKKLAEVNNQDPEDDDGGVYV